MALLCREFGVSRETSYKIYTRYKRCGLAGLTRSQPATVPADQPAPLPDRAAELKIEREKPSWGAPKILEKLRWLESSTPTPAMSTVHAVLDRHGLVSRRKRHG